MGVGTYTEIKTGVANWLARDDLTSVIPDFIRLAEQALYRRLRTRGLEEELSDVIASGTIAVPSNYIALKYAYVDGAPVQWLDRKGAEWIYRKYPTRSSDGKPVVIARERETFIFGPFPDDAYTIKGVYYKTLTRLSDSNNQNWLTDNVPDLLLFGALIESAPYIAHDARLQIWKDKYNEILDEANAQDGEEGFSGSVLMTSRA